MPEVASRVVSDLEASDLALDVFSSGTSAHLRVCDKYWSAQDSAWKVGRYLRELGMPPLTLQEECLTKGTSCPSHCPMSGAS